MRVLITGGAGFIGSHLAAWLVGAGHGVRVLDDLSTGQMSNLDGLIGTPGFEHRVGSVTDAALVAEMVDGCDVTVHLAAAVGVRLIIEQPVRTIETNVLGTEAVLRAVACRRALVLIASSSEVYGKSVNVPYAEDDDLTIGATVNSRWAYACSKALDEWLALAYWRERKVPVIVTRLFNTVGPRQTGRYGMVLPTFASQAVRNEPITVFGSGEQSRCFAHVADVVTAMVKLIETPAAVGEVFNIGGDREVTMNELAELVRDAAGSRSEIRHVPYAEAYADGFEDMQRRVPDVRKLERVIGMRPSSPLATIIRDVVDDQRAQASGG